MDRYIGNKTRIVDWIVGIAGEILCPSSVVADPMCGTAAVSAAFRSAGHRVVAGDVLTCAVQSARIRLFLDAPPPFGKLGGYETVLDELNRLRLRRGYFWQEFSAAGRPTNGSAPRNYFSPENAARIDAIRAQLQLWERQNAITPIEATLIKHDLVRAANRVANIAGTYGHFRRRLETASMRQLRVTATRFGAGPTAGHQVKRSAAVELVRQHGVSLAYVDPPYTWRQYGANYHVPETIARGDEPAAVGVSGLRPWRDTHSDFCLPRRVETSFRQLFSAARAKWLLVSYSEEGLLSIDRLSAILGDYGRVRVESTWINRFRSNRGGTGGQLREYLLVADCRRSTAGRS